MLDIQRDNDGLDTKFYFSHSVLPGYIDPQNVSTKKKPFSTFNAQPFSHTVCTPAEEATEPRQVKKLIRA
jgi:ribonuclease P/MRP protein subunit RPP40